MFWWVTLLNKQYNIYEMLIYALCSLRGKADEIVDVAILLATLYGKHSNTNASSSKKNGR